MEDFLGRKLKDDEIVHHIDKNQKNNNIDNLKIMNYQEHLSFHHAGISINKKRIPLNKIDGEKAKQMIELKKLNSSLTYSALAKMFGISNQTARNYILAKVLPKK